MYTTEEPQRYTMTQDECEPTGKSNEDKDSVRPWASSLDDKASVARAA